MPTKPGTVEQLLGEIGPILAEVESRFSSANVLTVLAGMGFQFPPELLADTALANSLDNARSAAAAILSLLDDLAGALDGDDPSVVIQKAVASIQQFTLLFDALDDVAARLEDAAAALGMTSAELSEFAREFPRRLVKLLVIERLETVSGVANTLQLLGIIERVLEPGVPGDPTRPEFETKRLHLSNLLELIRSPTAYFERLYGWGSATFDGVRLFEQLEDFFARSGLPVLLVPATATEPLKLRVTVFELSPDPDLSPPGLALTLETPIEANLSTTLPLGHPAWTLQVITAGQFVAGITGSISPPADVELRPPNGTLEGQLLLKIVGQSPGPDAQIVLLGVAGSSRLEVGRVEALLGMRFASDGTRTIGEPIVDARLEKGRVVLDTSKGDSFLSQVLGNGGGDAAFDLRVFWSASTGLRFEGSSALDITLPVHQALGSFELVALFLRVSPGDDAFQAEVSGNFRGRLGSLTFVIQRLGLKVQAIAVEERGNFGPLNLETLFKPPTAIGLSIDGGGFKGGGFIEFDPEDESYAGMLELEFQDLFTLKAFGLLTTRLPNNQKGFSLLILISAEFTPIQLGLGFKLNGVGGLLGLNRTVRVEPLRAGLRANTLSSILFPTDIIANAARIISDLKQVFPPQADRFIFGPMAKIAWGTPTLVTVDLGLVIEIPDPVRLFILGVLRAVLPDERAAILRVQVNFLGELNFERRQLKFDASLFDSKLLAFTLTGDMAIRLDWGADANFLLTVGGFHPAYEPPPMDLPAIRRLTLSLLQGDNPRLKLEMYFAVTSNTAQFGAKLELYAAAWKFNVYGFLSFDVLFQFSPFYFIAEITAMLALRIGSSSFASIKLSLTLEGPTPWKAQGTARFKICWFFTLKVRFNKTFGEARNTTLPDLAVLPLLAEALRADDNWEGELPSQRHRLESIRKAPEITSQLLLHPVGTLKISQKVVPLNVRIDRIGSQRPSDAREFRITQVQPEATLVTPQEAFGPAQFFDMTDEEKLTSASFKDFDSGLRIGDAERLHTGYAAARQVDYELKYIDSQGDQRLRGPKNRFDVNAGAFNTWTLQGAIAQSELSFARTRKSSLAPEAVVVSQESFAIVNSGDLKLFDGLSLLGSERAAAARLNQLIETNPTLRDTLQVVPAFERAA
ncbi:MAG: DUF6603 domain-containing protein [Acidobacteriota bacterium]